MTNTLGLQVRRDRIDPVGLYATAARARLATTREDRVTVTGGGPYFSNMLEWTPWFRTIAGVRADLHHFDVESNLPANSGPWGGPPSSGWNGSTHRLAHVPA